LTQQCRASGDLVFRPGFDGWRGGGDSADKARPPPPLVVSTDRSTGIAESKPLEQGLPFGKAFPARTAQTSEALPESENGSFASAFTSAGKPTRILSPYASIKDHLVFARLVGPHVVVRTAEAANQFVLLTDALVAHPSFCPSLGLFHNHKLMIETGLKLPRERFSR